MLAVAGQLVAGIAQASIVLQNGSFEDGTLTGGGGAYEAIGNGVTFEHWTSDGGSAYVGHHSGWGITPDDGAEIMNIRNHAAATLYQSLGTVANTAESSITLTFKHQQIAGSPTFKAGLYDAATGGNLLAETAELTPVDNVWSSVSLRAFGIADGTTVYVRFTTTGTPRSAETALDTVTISVGNALQNGSFEDGTLTGGGGTYEAIGNGVTFEHWTSDGGSAYVGHHSGWGITPDDGAEIMNIRNHTAATLYQSLGTLANAVENDITLTFKYQQVANTPSFKAGLYDAATGGNLLAETAYLTPVADVWTSASVTALDVAFGTSVYVRFTTALQSSNPGETALDTLTLSVTLIPQGTVIVIR